jgi:hypothetical protein
LFVLNWRSISTTFSEIAKLDFITGQFPKHREEFFLS